MITLHLVKEICYLQMVALESTRNYMAFVLDPYRLYGYIELPTYNAI